MGENTHSKIGVTKNGSTYIACGIPDKCEHDYSISVYITQNGKELEDQDSIEDGDSIIEGTSKCSKCNKLFFPDMFLF